MEAQLTGLSRLSLGLSLGLSRLSLRGKEGHVPASSLLGVQFIHHSKAAVEREAGGGLACMIDTDFIHHFREDSGMIVHWLSQ